MLLKFICTVYCSFIFTFFVYLLKSSIVNYWNLLLLTSPLTIYAKSRSHAKFVWSRVRKPTVNPLVFNLQRALRCPTFVRNRGFLQHFNKTSFALYFCVFGQNICDSYSISGVQIYCTILFFCIYIWWLQPFFDK